MNDFARRLHCALVRRLDRMGGDRGDVPGWVLVSVMTAGLVTAIWLVADDQLTGVLDRAISSVVAAVTASAGGRPDRGSAVVEFVLVAPLVLLLALGVLQVALVLHVRATFTSAAAEGARAAALAGGDPDVGVRRTRDLLARNVAGSVVQGVSAGRETVDGLSVMAVRIDGILPMVGLLGPTALTIVGHALPEL